MKKSIRRKLIMSAVAVGAAALATTSSTYAWFVSNAEVKTSIITGSITSSEANLQISATENGEYGVTATPSVPTTKLKTITKAASSAFGVYQNISGSTASDGYVEFSLWFKASGLAKQNYKLSLERSTDAAAPKDSNADKKYTALASVTSDGYTTITAGDQISEDVTKAMYLSVDRSVDLGTVNIPFNSAKGEYDGVKYYNTVTGTSTAQASTVTAYGYNDKSAPRGIAIGDAGFSCDLYTISNDTEGATVKFEVKFQIWLDGADDAGFDAIAGHNWSVGLNFKLSSAA